MDIRVKYKSFVYQNVVLEYLVFTPHSFWRRWLPFLYKGDFLFLHGFNDPSQKHVDMFQLIADRGYTVYALNMPGHGHSEPLPHISWEVLGNIVVEFCKHLHLKNMILSGFSMGGGLALKLAHDPTIRPKELRLIAPACSPIAATELETIKGVVLTTFQTIEDILSVHKPIAFNPYKNHYVFQAYPAMFAKFDADLTHNKVPIHVILLENDEMVTAESVKNMLQGVNNASIQVMPDLPHDIYYISEQRVQQLVDKLFS